jgi:hypothetical protein
MLRLLCFSYQRNRVDPGISDRVVYIVDFPIAEFRDTDPAAWAGGKFDSIPHAGGEIMPGRFTTSGCDVLILTIRTRVI